MASNKKSRNTKERIVDAARRLFAEKGYQQTTMMDIARETELSEAAPYEYFKGKEDLLLTIPDIWVSDLLGELEDQLFGIEGAFNKLKKYVWWTFRRVEQSPLDAKIVYLFLKTNSSFMQTDVYRNVQSLYAKLVEIFEEGRQSGEMNPDMDPHAARAIVVGAIDHMVTRWLLKDMSYSVFKGLDETFALLVNAFRPPPGTVREGSGSGQCASLRGEAEAETG